MALGSPLVTGCSTENTVAEQVFNPAVHAPSANDYIESRNAKFQAGPYQGAIADYNKVLAIDPHLSAAYDDRIHTKDELGDQRGACAGYKKSVSLGLQHTAKRVPSSYSPTSNQKA